MGAVLGPALRGQAAYFPEQYAFRTLQVRGATAPSEGLSPPAQASQRTLSRKESKAAQAEDGCDWGG